LQVKGWRLGFEVEPGPWVILVGSETADGGPYDLRVELK